MIAEKRRLDLFIVLSRDEIIDLLLARISQICTVRKDPKLRDAFTAGIDATDLVKSYQVSMVDHEMVGGASRNDLIPIDGLSKDHIFERFK